MLSLGAWRQGWALGNARTRWGWGSDCTHALAGVEPFLHSAVVRMRVTKEKWSGSRRRHKLSPQLAEMGCFRATRKPPLNLVKCKTRGVEARMWHVALPRRRGFCTLVPFIGLAGLPDLLLRADWAPRGCLVLLRMRTQTILGQRSLTISNGQGIRIDQRSIPYIFHGVSGWGPGTLWAPLYQL